MNKKILIVDDEPDVRSLICSILKAERFDVQDAGDGSSAVDLLKKDGIGLVLLDIMMPGMDGIETAREMRKFSKVPIVVVSIKADDISEDLIKRLDFAACVQKPFNTERLLGAVNGAFKTC